MTATTTTAPQTFDQARADAFAGQVINILNGGSLALMISIGHRTGLFTTLAEAGPATSEQLATAAGLNERYVREWLGAVTTGRIVEYDPASRRFTLPAEHAHILTPAGGTANLAPFGSFISCLANVEDKVVDAFRNGGGVPYTDFATFHRVMGDVSGVTFDHGLLEYVLPAVPGITQRLEEGIDVCDVGCGQGRALNILARNFPRSRFTGWDISPAAIATAREEAAALGLVNVTFEVKDAATIDGSRQFDFITTFDAVHDQAKPADVLRGINQALRTGGIYLCVDIAASSALENNLDHPAGPWLYGVSTMHCMTVSLAEGGAGLGTVWGIELALQLLDEAGFSDVQVVNLLQDPLNNYYIAPKAA